MSRPRSVRRPALTFQVRRRSLSPRRQAEFDQWIERWGLDLEGSELSWPDVFGRDGDVALDIGFGHGESTVRLAAEQPGLDVIAVEVHTPGVATVLDAIERQGLHHVRVVHGNVLPFLDRIPASSLAVVRIFFPDPWPKVRTRHRRLVGGFRQRHGLSAVHYQRQRGWHPGSIHKLRHRARCRGQSVSVVNGRGHQRHLGQHAARIHGHHGHALTRRHGCARQH